VRSLLGKSEAELGRWRDSLSEALGPNGQLIVNLVPELELVIGKQPPVADLPPQDAQNRFQMVFRRFLGVFARKEHPLALFLDDLQWLDTATLDLLEHLATHSEVRHLLLVGAYRDNEISPSHPLLRTLEAIRAVDARVHEIVLAPLELDDVGWLIADALHCEPERARPLAELVQEKTGGNPFFAIQFFIALADEGLVAFDPAASAWQWNIDRIRAKNYTDNVVDLMTGRLRRFSSTTQEALKQLACLGNVAPIATLVLVRRTTEQAMHAALWEAVHAGLVFREDSAYKFLHDRIQQAAYSLIPEAQRAEVHLRIGRVLLASMTADQLAEHLFDVANQFNRGAARLIDRDEKAQVAMIDLRAGRKAKASAAYASACVYLVAGMALLDQSNWDSHYKLTFSLRLERAECELPSGNFETVEQLILELLQRGASKVDQAGVYHLKVLLHTVKSESAQAVDSALTCLRLFGIDLPVHPTLEQVQAEYESVWQTLNGRPIESLIDQPLMTDPELQAAMQVLSVLTLPAYLTDSRLWCLHVCRMVNISMQHGASGAAAHAYGNWGSMLGPLFHRYRDAHSFAKLACDLVEKHGFLAYRARVHYATGMVAFWTQPITTAIEFNRGAFRTATETGDMTTACYSVARNIIMLLQRNDPLDAVWRESEVALDFVQKANYADGADIIVSQQRFIATMLGRTTSFSTYSDSQFDEATFEAQLTGERMSLVICWYWFLKLKARFLAGEYAEALAAAEKPKTVLWASPVHIQLLDYFYYTALTVAALYENATADQQNRWHELLTAHREQLREWADAYPPTFADKHALVAAEIARLEGRDPDAMRLYEQAIQSAREHGFVQNEAVAHEVAARFFTARGFDTIAHACLRESRRCYLSWGAAGKVRQLDARMPPACAPSAASSASRSAPLPSNVAQLDLLSVAKASQAISGQIVLEDLVDTLMHIVLENAGAETGQLLLARSESLVLAAEASVEQQKIQVRHLNQALATPALLESVLPEPAWPGSIVNYVHRCQERVLLDDATQTNPFSADDYFARRQPKSVLCLPIMRRSALIGLLYLENNLATHAFTPERVTVLELLASQAAISLENALLYADLQQENSERKRAEEALREREARIRRLGDSNIIGLFFWDVGGNVTEANDAFLQMVGYSRQDLLSGEVRWDSMTPAEYRAADAESINELRQAGTNRPYEKEYVRKDGRRVPVLIGAALLEGSQENGVAFVLDLTERKEAEAERAARRAAEAANQAKNAFLANMSHELRTPLNGILGYAQILRRDTTLEPRQREGLNVIQQSGEQLLTLINDILDFAKIEAGKVELSLTDIALAKFLRLVAEIIEVRARQKGLDFVCDVTPPNMPRAIRADEGRLRQVLLNLLANAVKFTDRGQVSLRVRFSPPTRLRFEVHDTGIGVGADHLETIFQPFEQVSASQRRLGGAGLGLAISRQFVRLMGSDIHVTSQVGAGSTFWFELDVPVIETETLARPERLVTGYEGPRKKVLVVDDVAANRAMAVDMLSQLGFDVVEATNGPEALHKTQAARPDWILTDIVMPDMDGLEVTRRVRRIPGFKDLPIIAMSASASGSDERESLAAGANAFVPKPIDVDKLANRIATLLKLHWTYGPHAASSAEHEAVAPLVAPPRNELETLHQLARMGNMRDIVQWAGRVDELDARYRPFADQLRLLAKGYQSKAIMTLVQRYL
jgi:PAS domain S-box-containing protein